MDFNQVLQAAASLWFVTVIFVGVCFWAVNQVKEFYDRKKK